MAFPGLAVLQDAACQPLNEIGEPPYEVLANPDAVQSKIQKEYQQPLLNLKDTGIAIADMTAIHEELLRHKAYQDMTGNNVNHPNDYLARWYAQVVSALLIR